MATNPLEGQLSKVCRMGYSFWPSSAAGMPTSFCFFIGLSLLGLTVGSLTVGYDHRALLIDGQRRFLISGSIHYTRSTPEMWPSLIALAKEGGLDAIDTYVFWDAHEPVKGQYDFEGQHNLAGFIQAVQNAGLYVVLRIGPYICAERNFGGFPRWLKEIPGIKLRTDNEPFKQEMERYVKLIVNKMRENDLFYNQGGPIIFVQIENEYRRVLKVYGDAGRRYLDWTATLASNMNISVPWTMCQQAPEPENIIVTCNGFSCHSFRPRDRDKPKMWTENYPGWLHYWGEPLLGRAIEDTAFAVARFFQTGGSFMNHYMYHGGTNFGRTSARMRTTSYDYHAPIDEYGRLRQPVWSHFKDLHAAIKLCIPAMAAVDDEPELQTRGKYIEIYVYNTTKSSSSGDYGAFLCAAFLANTGKAQDAAIQFNERFYNVPAWSISILPDCTNVVYNTAKVAAQTTISKMVNIRSNQWVSEDVDGNHKQDPYLENDTNVEGRHDKVKNILQWEWSKEHIGAWGAIISANKTLEQFSLTKDATDYLWYTTTINLPEVVDKNSPIPLWLKMRPVRDIIRVFVNGREVGLPPILNGSAFYQPVTLGSGANTLDLLSVTIGLPSSGPFLEAWTGGVSGPLILEGLSSGPLSLTNLIWTHQVGLKGELSCYQNDDELGRTNSMCPWSSGALPVNESLVWYSTSIELPGDDIYTGPLALDLWSMSKGAAWINGHHLGRYWPSQLNPLTEACIARRNCDYRNQTVPPKCELQCGQPSQRWYHVPREWTKRGKNRLVLFEEVGGDPRRISIYRPVIHTVCSRVSESHPPNFSQLNFTSGIKYDPQPVLNLDCGDGNTISEITFASFGDPFGRCGTYSRGRCHSRRSEGVVKQACIGNRNCSLNVHKTTLGEDPCPGWQNLSLAVEARCTPDKLIRNLEMG